MRKMIINCNKQRKFHIMFILVLVFFIVARKNIVKANPCIETFNSKNCLSQSVNINMDKTIVVNDKDQFVHIEEKSVSSLSRGGSINLNSNNKDIVQFSYKFLGSSYVWGAEGPKVFDCSGFVKYVYKRYGINLGHYTGTQYKAGIPVNKKDLVKGDLVFFNTYEPVSHVGIYIGDGKFIHASSGKGEVTISNLSKEYYLKRYAGARRILN